MNKKENHGVYSAEGAWVLEMSLRKFLYNPKRILGGFLKEGMTVLDFGCGPGFFTIPAAEMVGKTGKVIAADLQEEMLEKVRQKIKGKEIEKQILLHKCSQDSIGLGKDIKLDVVLAFYVVHEVPNSQKFFQEAFSLLKSGGLLLFLEPYFEVSKEEFREQLKTAEKEGFKFEDRLKVSLSNGAVLKK